MAATKSSIFTALSYPLIIHSVQLSGLTLDIFMPDAQQVKLRQMQPQQQVSPFPYWTKLWPSAIALSNFLLQQPRYVAGKTILELGAGIGLPSLVAARTASAVLCTDLSVEAMQVAAKSAALNGLQNLECRCMDWNNIDADATAETLLLSDVNYEPSSFEALKKLMTQMLQRGTSILLATPQRLMAVPFVNFLKPFTANNYTLIVKDALGEHPITILVLSGGAALAKNLPG